MTRTVADKRSAAIFESRAVRALSVEVQQRARVKLLMIDASRRLQDLRAPPGNRLEALRGDRDGRYGIRVNQRWRVCFLWRDGDAWEVEVVDYH